MKESHRKGIASHPDPESCGSGRKASAEALTGAHAGQPSSCEIRSFGVPMLLSEAEGHTEIGVIGEPTSDPALALFLWINENNQKLIKHAIKFQGNFWAILFRIKKNGN